MRPGRSAAAALLVYLAASLILFGRPVLAHLASDCVCIGNTHDEGAVAWSLEWWPHALLHGLNPFFPRLIYAPTGIDIAQGASMPGLAFALWPVTALAGPLFAFNLAALLAPALAAFFAFLLCRRLTGGAWWASLLGGWLFGFSTYVLGQETGHANLALVFLVPALVHIGVRLYQRELRGWGGVALLTLALAGQFSLSTEVFATFTGFAAIALAAGWLLGDTGQRAGVRALLVPVGLAYLATAVIVSPYLYYALKPGGEPILPARTGKYSADLLSFVIPNVVTRLGGLDFLSTTGRFTAGYVEGATYLGLPLLALAGFGLWRGRRRRQVRLLGVMLIITLVCSLGAHLHVNGASAIPLPWALVSHLRLLGIILPARLVMYSTLILSVLVAITLAELTAGARARGPALAGWVAGIAAVVFLWPAVNLALWHSRPLLPRLFATTAYRRVIGPRDTVLIPPIGIYGDGMLWQAEARLSFPMAGGYIVPPEAPDPYQPWKIYPTLAYNVVVADVEAAAARFLAAHHVTVAILPLTNLKLSPWPRILARLGWSGRVRAGTLVLRPPVRAQATRAAAAARRKPGPGSSFA